MNNGTEEQPTSANLLGPFWRKGAPVMKNGDSIVRSRTEGPPLFFTGTVPTDLDGTPPAGAEVDVWHASPVGLYENQDPEQAEWNLRGKFYTDDDGVFAFRSVKPSGYPVPMGGPVGDLLTTLKRHPFRPAPHPRDGLPARLQDHHVPALQPRRPHARHRRAVRRHPCPSSPPTCGTRPGRNPAPAPDVTEPGQTLRHYPLHRRAGRGGGRRRRRCRRSRRPRPRARWRRAAAAAQAQGTPTVSEAPQRAGL